MEMERKGHSLKRAIQQLNLSILITNSTGAIIGLILKQENLSKGQKKNPLIFKSSFFQRVNLLRFSISHKINFSAFLGIFGYW
jgi:hypothetical protein